MAARTAPSTAAAVRTWGESNGFPRPASGRGRLNPGLVEAFNTAHPKAQYVEGTKPDARVEVKVSTKDKAGRNRTAKVKVKPSDARAYALDNGVAVAPKGRVPEAVMQAYALSTLGK